MSHYRLRILAAACGVVAVPWMHHGRVWASTNSVLPSNPREVIGYMMRDMMVRFSEGRAYLCDVYRVAPQQVLDTLTGQIVIECIQHPGTMDINRRKESEEEFVVTNLVAIARRSPFLRLQWMDRMGVTPMSLLGEYTFAGRKDAEGYSEWWKNEGRAVPLRDMWAGKKLQLLSSEALASNVSPRINWELLLLTRNIRCLREDKLDGVVSWWRARTTADRAEWARELIEASVSVIETAPAEGDDYRWAQAQIGSCLGAERCSELGLAVPPGMTVEARLYKPWDRPSVGRLREFWDRAKPTFVVPPDSGLFF